VLEGLSLDVITRCGHPASLEDVNRVAASLAKTVVLLHANGDNEVRSSGSSTSVAEVAAAVAVKVAVEVAAGVAVAVAAMAVAAAAAGDQRWQQ
jgi:hypothetical protein